MPALGDCQHAHDPWRSTDHHQGSFGSGGRSCLRSLEFIFPHHRQSKPNGTAVDVRRLAAYAGLDFEQRALNIDGGAGTALYRFDGNLERLGFLRYDVTNLAYAIPNLKTGAVIGVGGGRDVLSQRLFGLGDVTGIEINPIIVDILKHHFSDYTAIAVLDGVKFEVDEARSWFARTPRSFDVIQMSLIIADSQDLGVPAWSTTKAKTVQNCSDQTLQ